MQDVLLQRLITAVHHQYRWHAGNFPALSYIRFVGYCILIDSGSCQRRGSGNQRRWRSLDGPGRSVLADMSVAREFLAAVALCTACTAVANHHCAYSVSIGCMLKGGRLEASTM